MPQIEVQGEGSATLENFTISASLIPLHMSYLLLISDQPEYGLGTVSLATPPSGFGTKATSSPFNLFGLKNTMIANLLGKNASHKLKKPVLSLIFIKNNSKKQEIVMKLSMEAVNKAIEQILEQKKHQEIDQDDNQKNHL